MKRQKNECRVKKTVLRNDNCTNALHQLNEILPALRTLLSSYSVQPVWEKDMISTLIKEINAPINILLNPAIIFSLYNRSDTKRKIIIIKVTKLGLRYQGVIFYITQAGAFPSSRDKLLPEG